MKKNCCYNNYPESVCDCNLQTCLCERVAAPTGTTVVSESSSAMIISFNDGSIPFPAEGLKIESEGRLPLMQILHDVDNLISLDKEDNVIKINKKGLYKITFSTNVYVKKSDTFFNPITDFAAVSFREEKNEEKIIASANTWTPYECATNVFGQGIFEVTDTNQAYELVNMQLKDIYVNGCNLNGVVSESCLVAPLVSIIITKIK